jgi:hypothetical protein
MSWTIAGKYVRAAATDPDAQAYLQAVEDADGQSLEFEVARAIDNFVLGCKADGIWSAIKASCILAGARTLSGALVPLVGAAPTSFNFEDADYNRKTGLVGDGSTKHLNSNRNNNADPQNNKHIAAWVSTHHPRDITRAIMGANSSNTSGCQLMTTTAVRFFRVNWTGTSSIADTSTPAGFWGASRALAGTVVGRISGVSTNIADTSLPPANASIRIFDRGSDPSNARLSYYSIGESLDLALLDARVTDLINAFDTAIPS